MADDEDTGDDFREAMSGVVPLAQTRVAPEPEPPEVSAAQLLRRDAAEGKRPTTEAVDPNPLTLGEVPFVQPRDTLAWKKDGVQNEVFKKLRGGQYRIDGRLDLHRHTVREARQALYDFLQLAQRKGWRTLLVSHGRGEHSPTPARIKSYVAHWLSELPVVIAYHSAARQHGGTGSVYVMIRKSDEARELARERHGLKS